MTCDNNRPCERCVARGLAETCRDGVRKKAKYLSDVPEAVARSEEALKFDPRYTNSTSNTKKSPSKIAKQPDKTATTGTTAAIAAKPSSPTVQALSEDNTNNTDTQKSSPMKPEQNVESSLQKPPSTTPNSSQSIKPLNIPQAIRQPASISQPSSSPNQPSPLLQSQPSNQSSLESQNIQSKPLLLDSLTHSASSLNINTATTSPFNSLLSSIPEPASLSTTQLPQLNIDLINRDGTLNSNTNNNNENDTNIKTTDDISGDAGLLLPPLGNTLINDSLSLPTSTSSPLLLPSQNLPLSQPSQSSQTSQQSKQQQQQHQQSLQAQGINIIDNTINSTGNTLPENINLVNTNNVGIPGSTNTPMDLNDPNSWLNNLRPSRHNFQSMAVNMEYSIISNIINATLSSSNPSSNTYNLDLGGVPNPTAIPPAPNSSSAYSPSLSSAGGDSPLPKYSNDIYGTPNHHQGLGGHGIGGSNIPSGLGPGGLGTGNLGGIGFGGNHNQYGNNNNPTAGVFHLNNLNQYALGLPYSVPSSIAYSYSGPGGMKNGGGNGNGNGNGTVQNLPEVLDLITKLKQAKKTKMQQEAMAAAAAAALESGSAATTGLHSWLVPDSPPGPKRPLSLTISTRPITPHNTPTHTPNSSVDYGTGSNNNINSINENNNNTNNNHVNGNLNDFQQSSSSFGRGGGGGFGNNDINRMPGDDGNSWMFRKYSEPADIYAGVRQPYSYTPAYHQLTIYIRTRFTRDQQLRIAKCMASYRPSFIACTNTLKEDDLIFMEQCFQRTLLEYEKFISYSGTPTAVWRRTGQVAAVGKEFCMLTGWPRERLLNEHTFIVELMDDNSVLEYFEMFSKMAFGDSRGATMTECTLLTPQGLKIKTSSIWTLKRDVFGIPMMIVGNFLPILNNN